MEPVYWKTRLDDIHEAVLKVKRGIIDRNTLSAGGREIYLLRYGKKNEFCRTANLSSALGAGDRKCYADKTREDYRKTVLLAGCIHGGEFEGTAALLNLINILETGKDLAGTEYSRLAKLCKNITLLIIPCINPDGRARIKENSLVGKSYTDLRYLNQGTWKDGKLCGYPDCKRVHPIKEKAGFLGAYFNDNGVNLMHDDFFGNKCPENQFLFSVTDEYVPDFTVLLHGGTNTVNCMLKPAYAPMRVKRKIIDLEHSVKKHCDAENIKYKIESMDLGEEEEIPASFNLPSALYHLSGEPCVTYESNQGLTEYPGAYGYEEIYKSHMILFEELIKNMIKKR